MVNLMNSSLGLMPKNAGHIAELGGGIRFNRKGDMVAADSAFDHEGFV